jgi:hypothetical protein
VGKRGIEDNEIPACQLLPFAALKTIENLTEN